MSTVENKFTKRDLFGLGAAAILGTACGSTQESPPQPRSTAALPQAKGPSREPAAPVPIKEVLASRVLWTEGIVIPIHPTDLRLTRDAFFVADNSVFFTSQQGYPTAYNIEKGRAWRWEEDPGLVYGAESDAVYVFRQDGRLFAIDAKSGQKKWSRVFPTMSNANIEWPFLICKDTVHPTFHSPRAGLPNPIAGLDKPTGEIKWISEGKQKAIDQTQETIVAQYWASAGTIFGIDALTGRVRWEVGVRFTHLTPDELYRQITADRLIHIKPQGNVVVLDIDSGQEVWQTRARNHNRILAVSPHRVYTSSGAGPFWLTILDRASGTLLAEEKEFDSNDFIDEKNDWFVWTQSKLGQTRIINVVNGASTLNDDLRLTGVAGTVKNILVGFYADPSRRQSFLYGIDITSKNADRKWRVPVEQATPSPVIIRDRIVYSSGQALSVLDAETGNRLTNIALPGATHFTKHKNTLLVQAGNPGQVGNLSAVYV